MRIIAHRGLWSDVVEKNSEEAIILAFENNFGIETDIRDLNAEIIISHDPPSYKLLTLEKLISIHGDFKNEYMFLNIKSDGLSSQLAKLSPEIFSNCFFFDMSIPEMVRYSAHKLPILSRMSEVEPISSLIHECSGIWLDSLYGNWFGVEDINKFLRLNKYICIVSPELHGRNHFDLWNILRNIDSSNLFLCTDYPFEAKKFFGL
jgi:hypothetical protein